ncbi:hypothetical protein B0H19DRAFT_1231225 [Mycena capillaripes]|nr:hypothetical protein B0H19DRAFT_1231225 [Mycena capillaripes]
MKWESERRSQVFADCSLASQFKIFPQSQSWMLLPSQLSPQSSMRAARLTLYFLAPTVSALIWIFPEQRATWSGGFDTNQFIDVTGAHAFVAAGPDDLRGPCPGLNALANHNYIPHNGVVSVLQAILASFEVFGFGLDLVTVAGVLGLLYGAEVPLLEFSIGGPPGGLGGILGGILVYSQSEGKPSGLSVTHNQFESDSSATRCDLDEWRSGDDFSVQPDVFQNLLDLIAQNPDPIGAIIEHRVNRLRHSKAYNPYFFYGPVEMLISCITHTLIPGLMMNHSATYPEGYFSAEGLSSLYGVSRGPNGLLKYTRDERIPHHWYRRPLSDPYLGPTHGLPDLLRMWFTYNETLVIGGNIGTVNSFIPIDIRDFTFNAYTPENLLEGSNAACFLFQFVQVAIPGLSNNLEALLAGILTQVADAVEQQMLELELACPKLEAFKLESLEMYPGYRKGGKRSV